MHRDSNCMLDGLKVLDLGQSAATGFCTKLLAAAGAEVILVERPREGNPLRRSGPFPNDIPHLEKSGLFLYLHTSKKSITLDITTAPGVEILARLIQSADILVDDLGQSHMNPLGLSYATLRQQCPALIQASITPFGQSGPRKDLNAQELNIWAASGYMYLTGDSDREPLKAWGYQAHYQGGLQATLGIMHALLVREMAGGGACLDISLVESLAVHCGDAISNYVFGHYIPHRVGNRTGLDPKAHYPNTTLPCKDGYIHAHFGSSLLEGIAELTEDSRLADPELAATARGHADDIDAMMIPWLMQHTKQEVADLAQERRIPFTPVLTVREVVDDQQFRARGYWEWVEHPEVGFLPYPKGPFQISDAHWRLERAPLLGEHNEDIYCGRMGQSRRDLQILAARGIV